MILEPVEGDSGSDYINASYIQVRVGAVHDILILNTHIYVKVLVFDFLPDF